MIASRKCSRVASHSRCAAYIQKRDYFYEYKFSFLNYDKAHRFRDVPLDKMPQDGFNSTADFRRWCDGAFLSHYNKEPLWWFRTVIKGKRFVESELWENGERDNFLKLDLSQQTKDEVCAMFQTVEEEKVRIFDLAERIKKAHRGELEVDDSAPPLPPINGHDYHALRVKFRYFCRASGGNTHACLYDTQSNETRNKLGYIYSQYTPVAQCDFDVLSFVAALEVARGPSVPFRFARQDGIEFTKILPDPETESADEIRALLLGVFTDSELVALCGLQNIKAEGVLESKYFETQLANKDSSISKDPLFKDAAEKYSVSFDYFRTELHEAVLKMTEYGVPEQAFCEAFEL